MKKHILIFASFTCLVAQAQAQMVIQSGAALKTTGNAVVALQDINLINNGTISQQTGDGKFLFSGTQANIISGTATNTQFDSILIAKTGTGKVSLGQNIIVGSGIKFTSGKIDMLDKNINLLSTAKLEGETETSHVTSTSTGYITITQSLNTPSAANPGNLGAVISSMQNLGSTVIKRGHASQVNASNGGSSILRYFDINPSNNTGLNATLKINYLDAELNGIAESNLNLFKSTDNITWQNMGVSAGSALSNYVEKSGISAFSRWTISSSNSPLPIDFTAFNLACNKGNINMSWSTARATNVTHFEVEYSANAQEWKSLGVVAFKTGVQDYAFNDANSEGFYRIAAVDFDHSKSYSEVKKVMCQESNNEISLWPNPTTDKAFVKMNAANESDMLIRIYDSHGKEMGQKNIRLIKGDNQFEINFINLSAGIYWLKMNWNNNLDQKTMKIVKQ